MRLSPELAAGADGAAAGAGAACAVAALAGPAVPTDASGGTSPILELETASSNVEDVVAALVVARGTAENAAWHFTYE